MRRNSIRSLMVFVLVSAVGLAALRNASDLWAGMLLLVTLAAVGVAVMGAVILRGRERCWWAGFAFFGGGYLALAVGPWLSDTFQPQLGTTHLLGHIQGRMHPSVVETSGDLAALQRKRERLVAQQAEIRRLTRSTSDPALLSVQKSLAVLDQEIATFRQIATRDQFQRVGHSLFALLAGLVGATVATWFYARRALAGVDSGQRSVERPTESAIQAAQ